MNSKKKSVKWTNLNYTENFIYECIPDENRRLSAAKMRSHGLDQQRPGLNAEGVQSHLYP